MLRPGIGGSGGGLSEPVTLAQVLTSSVASGSSAIVIQQGAKIITNGSTATRWISDDGVNITFTGAVSTSSAIAAGAFTANGGFTAGIASGSTAFSMLSGAKLITNGGTNTRWVSDDGTNVTVTGPVLTSGALAIVGALSGVTTGAFSGKITSTVASGSDAIGLVDGARINFGTGTGNIYRAGGAGLKTDASWTATQFTASNGSGSNTFIQVQGGRFDMAGGAGKYLAYDGTNFAFTGVPVSVTKLVVPAAGGAADTAGTATLVAGTVTVSTTAVTASSKIFLSRNTPGGVQGNLSQGTIVAGTSFVINSANAGDTSTVNWFLVN